MPGSAALAPPGLCYGERMRGPFRGLTDAIQSLAAAVRGAEEKWAEGGSALERIEALELSRGTWEAEVEATLLKADGKLKAANNAEARARTMERHVEKQLDPFDREGEEIPETIPEGDGAGGEEEWVQPVPVAVEANPKTRALRMKFG